MPRASTALAPENGLVAALAVLRGDPRAVRDFDCTVDGFWSSFRAVLIASPLFVLFAAAERKVLASAPAFNGARFDDLAFLGIEVGGFLLDWMLFPLVALLLMRVFGIERHYVPLVVAWNWSTPVALLMLAVPAGLYVVGAIGLATTTFAMVGGLGVALWYRWMVARAALAGQGLVAAAIVTAEFVVGIVVMRLIDFAATLLGVA